MLGQQVRGGKSRPIWGHPGSQQNMLTHGALGVKLSVACPAWNPFWRGRPMYDTQYAARVYYYAM